MLFPFYAAYLAVTRSDLRPAEVGLVIGAFGVGALVADVVSGEITRHISERVAAVIGMAGVAATVMIISATSDRWLLIAETAIWGFCYELINPVAYTLVAKAVPESARRFAFAAIRLAINAGMGIGPVVAGALFAIDPGLPVWGTALGYLLAAAILAKASLASTYESVDKGPQGAKVITGAHHERQFWSFFAAVIPLHFAYALPPTVMSVYIIQKLGYSSAWVSVVFAINALMTPLTSRILRPRPASASMSAAVRCRCACRVSPRLSCLRQAV
ncbi:MAG: MFS transporter [Jatrophihabitantaceae bacterium]